MRKKHGRGPVRRRTFGPDFCNGKALRDQRPAFVPKVLQTVRKLGGLIRGPELRPSFRGLRSTRARKISEIGLQRDVFRLPREFSHGLQEF